VIHSSAEATSRLPNGYQTVRKHLHGKCSLLRSRFTAMKTVRLFLADPNRSIFDARVLAIRDSALILDRSLFIPADSRHTGDRGSIDGVPIVSVQTLSTGETVHRVAPAHATGFTRRSQVSGELDWEHRHRLMRLSTAAFLVDRGLFHLFGVQTVKCLRLDSASNSLALQIPSSLLTRHPEPVSKLSEWVGAIVRENYPVRMIHNQQYPQLHGAIDGLGSASLVFVSLSRTGEIGSAKIEAGAEAAKAAMATLLVSLTD